MLKINLASVTPLFLERKKKYDEYVKVERLFIKF
jgi:hypothetical protein